MFHLIVFVNLLFLCSERGFLYDNSRKHHLTNLKGATFFYHRSPAPALPLSAQELAMEVLDQVNGGILLSKHLLPKSVLAVGC